MIKIKPEISWWWKPFKKPVGWLQLQLGVFIDWEPPFFTFGIDLIIVKLGIKFDWGK
ncbi:hypothetical protein ES703_93251 [subsurface metagenome]